MGDGSGYVSSWAARYGAWPHQIEAVERALSENSILNMPTGSGKTLVACMLLDLMGAPSLFVVNSRALVTQQLEYLRKHTSLEVGLNPAAGVFVATGEVMRTALETGQINAVQLRCVVFDEAHHAVGRHPYREVLGQLPDHVRVLGLTASFLHGNADPERRLQALEGSFRAKVFSPAQGNGRVATFTAVPWSRTPLDPRVIAAFTENLDAAIGRLNCEPFLNWELQSAVDREKGRLRGVLESLGSVGFRPFVQCGFVNLVHAKLCSKLSFADDDFVKCNLQKAIELIPHYRSSLASATYLDSASEEKSGKFEALRRLLQRLLESPGDKVLVFVERVAVAGPMAVLLSASLGLEIAQVCGVQGMEEATREWNLQRFRMSCRVMVSTSSLEEGLDVPCCRFVVRYDYFNSAKSHVQGSGRARHPQAEIFYFDNDPDIEEERRRHVEAACKEPRETEKPDVVPHHCSTAAPGTADILPDSGAVPSPGIGNGHAWGEESTLWDYGLNKSFRGMSCKCGARLHIASRAYGRGRKKKERAFSLEGLATCPLFGQGLDPRLVGVDPTTGILQEA